MRRLSTLCSILILSSASLAQVLPVEDQILPEEPAIRRYTVELIVFAYAEDVSVGSEVFIADEPIVEDEELHLIEVDYPLFEASIVNGEGPLADDSISEIEDVEEATAAEPDPLIDPETGEVLLEQELPFVLLPEEEYTLTNVRDQFELLDAYETVMHVAWTQPTYPREDTLPIELHAFGEVPVGLEGTFTLYLSRYLHLVIDLALDAERNNADEFSLETIDETHNAPVISFGDERQQNTVLTDPLEAELQEAIVRYRLQENRILRNGELRYFDHPKFGVIARVTRVEDDGEEVPIDEEEEEETFDQSRRLLSSIVE
jgi:hypothetical protein